MARPGEPVVTPGEQLMSTMNKVWKVLLIVSGVIGATITGSMAHATATGDAVPLGRTASAIVDGQYPASYFPNTELLGADEMRITALGTGMPNQTRAAVSISYLVELGNGDKFLFDIGTGANANLSALMIPFDFLKKVFLTHLHIDHWGDLPGLWAGGWTSGRTSALEVWGPSGATPEMGTAYAMENFLKTYNWDRSAPGQTDMTTLLARSLKTPLGHW